MTAAESVKSEIMAIGAKNESCFGAYWTPVNMSHEIPTIYKLADSALMNGFFVIYTKYKPVWQALPLFSASYLYDIPASDIIPMHIDNLREFLKRKRGYDENE
jgi:hypothetical protein